MNIIKRLWCRVAHRRFHKRYWMQFSTVFWACQRCRRHWSTRREN